MSLSRFAISSCFARNSSMCSSKTSATKIRNISFAHERPELFQTSAVNRGTEYTLVDPPAHSPHPKQDLKLGPPSGSFQAQWHQKISKTEGAGRCSLELRFQLQVQQKLMKTGLNQE